MSGMNTGRLFLGAFAAGMVVNVVESVMNLTVLAGPIEELLAAMDLEPLGGGAMGGFIVMAFLLGFLITWLYAAIRPRFGPGAGTALRAGFVVWVAFYLLPVGANWLMGMVPTDLYLITLAYTLPMMLAAAYVAGMVYKEE